LLGYENQNKKNNRLHTKADDNKISFCHETGPKTGTTNGRCSFRTPTIQFVTSTASYTGAFDASCFGFPATSASTLLVIGLRFK